MGTRKPDDSDLLEAELEAERVRNPAEAPTVPFLWPEPRPAYRVVVTLRDTGDHFECVGFDITKLDRGRPVNSTLMRSLPVGELVHEAIQQVLSNRAQHADSVVREPPPGGDVDEEFMRRRSAFWTEAAGEARRRQAVSGEGHGRRYPPDHLEDVARIALDARRRNQPTGAAVAEAFGISKSAAANQISRARAQGLLDSKEDR